jgi:cysteine desulfurase
MHVNNETGTVLDIKRMICAEHNVLFHSDTVQPVENRTDVRCPFDLLAPTNFTVLRSGVCIYKKNSGLQPLLWW